METETKLDGGRDGNKRRPGTETEAGQSGAETEAVANNRDKNRCRCECKSIDRELCNSRLTEGQRGRS